MTSEISLLISGLSDPDPTERSRAAEGLSRIGEQARGAAVPLARACGDLVEEVREWAVAALEELGPPSADDVDALAELLKIGNSDVGYWVSTLLGRLGADAASAVPALKKALCGPAEISVRQRAAWALGKIGPRAASAVVSLRTAAADADPRLARLARRAIDQIGG